MDLSEAIEQLSEKQELLLTPMESKKSLQKVALEEFQREIFQDLKEFEEQKSKEALELLGRKHKLLKLEKERDRVRMLQEGQKVILMLPQTVLPFVLARPLGRMTWMKQCPRPPGSLPPW